MIIKTTGYFGPDPTDNLINDLTSCLQFTVIPYKDGGIYDRVLSIIKEWKEQEELPENEEYQWVLMPTKAYDQIYLARPNLKQEYKTKSYIDQYGSTRIHSYVSNIVTLRKYFFKSVTTNTIAITFGDNKKLIKPFKKISHNWKKLREVYISDKPGILGLTNRTAPYSKQEYPWLFECRDCKIQGVSKKDEISSGILPETFLTCEEVIVKNILV